MDKQYAVIDHQYAGGVDYSCHSYSICKDDLKALITKVLIHTLEVTGGFQPVSLDPQRGCKIMSGHKMINMIGKRKNKLLPHKIEPQAFFFFLNTVEFYLLNL